MTLFRPRCDGGVFADTCFKVLIWRARLLRPRGGGRGAENPAEALRTIRGYAERGARHPRSLSGRTAEYSLSPRGGSVPALGRPIAQCLGLLVNEAGELEAVRLDEPPDTSLPERSLFKRRVAPARLDLLDVGSILQSIDDLIVGIGRGMSVQGGAFILAFDRKSGLTESVYATGRQRARLPKMTISNSSVGARRHPDSICLRVRRIAFL